MSDSAEFITKLLAIIGSIGITFKHFITITNKTEVETIFTPNQTRRWDEFLDFIFISLVNTGLLLFLTFLWIIPTEASWVKWIGNILPMGIVVLMISTLLIKGIMLLRHLKPKNNGLLSKLIMITYFALHVLMLYVTLLNRSLFREKILKTNYTFSAAYALCMFFFVILLTYSTRFVYKFFVQPPPPKFKVDKIEAAHITEELKNLYFIFAIDHETHVFSRFPTTRAKMKLPAYIFYPKENALYCYHKEQGRPESDSVPISRSRNRKAKKNAADDTAAPL